MKYDWGMIHSEVDAQVVGEHIEALIEKYKEHLTNEEILADARSARSPLHKCFNWDDTDAAEKYRHRQAKRLLKHLVSKTANERKTRAFVFVQMPGGGAKSYIPLRSAMGRPELRDQLLDNAVKPLERWLKVYGDRTDMGSVKKRVEQLRRAINAELLSAAGLSKH